MAEIRPVTELQRKTKELSELAIETREPIYLTKNGYKHLVLISADEYDKMAEELKETKK